MKYLEVEVRLAFTVHGYDQQNKEIIENVNEQDYMKKLVSIDRIQSVSEQYLLVTSSNGRVMYWEYKGSMAEIAKKLKKNNLIIG